MQHYERVFQSVMSYRAESVLQDRKCLTGQKVSYRTELESDVQIRKSVLPDRV
jgi:hypothetical protein